MISECHAHIFMNGTDYPAARALHGSGKTELIEEDIRSHLEAYRRCGIGYVRDGGDPFGSCILAAKLAPEYGIEYRHPAFALHWQGSYGGIVGRSFSSLQEYHTLVIQAGEAGADFIKIMFSGIMDFAGDGSVTGSPLSDQLIKETIHIAHEEGFAVMAHVNGDRTIRCALESGVDSIEHGNFMSEETVVLLAHSDAVWVPTVAPIHNLLDCGRFEPEVIRRLEEKQSRMIRFAFEHQVRMAAGSDAGAFCVPHGEGILTERTLLLRQAGELPEALRLLEQGEQWLREKFRRR